MPLIKPEDTWLLWAFAISWVAVSIWLENKYGWAAMISACAIALLGAMIFANVGVIPMASPVYDAINTYVLPAALPLLLFTADIRKIIRESGACFVAYHFAAIGSVIGILLACYIVPGIPDKVGVAVIATGCYVGGAVNMAAMADAFKVNPDIASASMVAGNVIMAFCLVFLMAVPKIGWFRKHFRHGFDEHTVPVIDSALTAEEKEAVKEVHAITVYDIALALAVTFVLTGLSVKFAGWYGKSGLPLAFLLGQKYLVITTFTIILTSLFPKWFAKLKGVEMGTFMMYLFFFGIGTSANIMTILQNAPMIFVFCLIGAVGNMVGVLGLGKLFKLKLEDLLIASNATIGGPTTATGMALALGWQRLIVPAVLIGVYGYSVGNYIGIFFGTFLKAIGF